MIIMYRDGFIVDDGPYRRLDDPINADFLRSLAAGQTPREFYTQQNRGVITVGLVDKRSHDYVPQFESFSGTGTTLGTTNSASLDGTFYVHSLPTVIATQPTDVNNSDNMIAINVRLLQGGQRRVLRLPASATVLDLAAHVADASDGVTAFRLVTGFPPRPLTESSATLADCKLQGAVVQMVRAE
jgi:UBX domain-containing protein 1